MDKICESCTKEFECGVSESDGECWCAALPNAVDIPPQFSDCLCEECLYEFTKNLF